MVVEGAVVVVNFLGAWTVPAGCAAWIPARTRFALDPLPRAAMRTLYIDPLRRGADADLSVLAVSPLLHAIVDHVCDSPALSATSAKTLAAVVRDQLPQQRVLPLFVPALTSSLPTRVMDALRSDPAGTPRIHDIAEELGVSPRTLERTFLADAGMPLGEWRQRARISRAVALLAEGMAVKDVALEVGYETASAFVAAFRKYVGSTPGKL